MSEDEARAWLLGQRSMTNIIMDAEWGNDRQQTLVRIAQADAAMVEAAYWTLRAHREGLLSDA